MTLLEILKQLLDEVTAEQCPSTGICAYVDVKSGYSSEMQEQLHELMLAWPLSTGSYAFPVPANEDDRSFDSAVEAYTRNTCTNTLWRYSNHSMLRYRLLYWMVDQLEKTKNENS
jgi:hypothetical protein